MFSVNGYPLTGRVMRRRSGLARRKSWQNFLADFFEDFGGVALSILEVEDDVVHTGRAQASEETKYDVSTSAETEVEGLWWGVWIINQIDVERLRKWFEQPRRGGGHGGTPARGEFRLLLKGAWVRDPTIRMLGDPF